MNRLMLALFAMVAFSLSVVLPAQADMFTKEVATEHAAVIAAKLTLQTLEGGYKLVDGPTLKKWMDDGKDMVIVDTMPYDSSYAKGHLPGAKQMLFPIPTMEKWDDSETAGKSKDDFRKLLGDDKDKLVVIYCGFTKCTRSHNGAAWAKKLGYKNVYRFPGGIYAWRGLDYKVEK